MNKIKITFEHRYYHLVMLIAIYGYALFSIPVDKIGAFCRAVLLVGSLGIFVFHHKNLFKDPMLLMLGLAIISSIVSWISSLIYVHQFAKHLPEIDKLARLFIFIPIAYWLRGKPKSIYLMLVLFMISFIWGVINNPNFVSELMDGLNGTRVDFDIKNAQYTSMFSGICLIISTFGLYQIILQRKFFSHNLMTIISFSFLFSSAIFFFIITIITQSRMVYLALFIIIVLLPFLYKISFNTATYKNIFLYYITVISLCAVSAYFAYPLIAPRLGQEETSAITDALEFDFNNIPMSSAGIRLNSWIEATHWISQYPLFGIGSRGSAIVIITSQLFAERIDEAYGTLIGLRHLHSFHMDTLVCYGFFGFFVLNGTYFVMLNSLIRLRKLIPYSNYWIMMALCIVVYWLTINGFESFNYRTYGVLTHNIFMAAFYTFALTNRLFPHDAEEALNENSCGR